MRASSIAPRTIERSIVVDIGSACSEQLGVGIEMHSDTLQRLAYYCWEIAAHRYQPNCRWDRECNRDIIETPMIERRRTMHRARLSAAHPASGDKEGEGLHIYARG
jgi:hypothetical protein